MQTQCPHCKTRFRVTDSQISIADGLVRCGVCEQIFNAFDVAGQNDHQPSSLNHSSPAETAIEADTDAPHDGIEISHVALKSIALTIDDETGNSAAAEDSNKKESLDFFDETINESLPYVVPEKFRDSDNANPHPIFPGLLWGAGVLLLTASLLLEYAWFNRDQFRHIPELQLLLEKLCGQFDCSSRRDPASIELITRNVYSHPNEKNALMISLTIKNNADTAQPYPVMQVEFSDIRGAIVAARRFLPEEYLAEQPRLAVGQPALLPAVTSSTINLEIQDPGKQAMTYEFTFL